MCPPADLFSDQDLGFDCVGIDPIGNQPLDQRDELEAKFKDIPKSPFALLGG